MRQIGDFSLFFPGRREGRGREGREGKGRVVKGDIRPSGIIFSAVSAQNRPHF